MSEKLTLDDIVWGNPLTGFYKSLKNATIYPGKATRDHYNGPTYGASQKRALAGIQSIIDPKAEKIVLVRMYKHSVERHKKPDGSFGNEDEVQWINKILAENNLPRWFWGQSEFADILAKNKLQCQEATRKFRRLLVGLLDHRSGYVIRPDLARWRYETTFNLVTLNLGDYAVLAMELGRAFIQKATPLIKTIKLCLPVGVLPDKQKRTWAVLIN